MWDILLVCIAWPARLLACLDAAPGAIPCSPVLTCAHVCYVCVCAITLSDCMLSHIHFHDAI